jgi:hypothetical protein
MVRAVRSRSALASPPGAVPASAREPASDATLEPALALEPACLPAPESPQRWAFLQELRRGTPALEVWLEAIEAGRVAPLPDLLAALHAHLDPPASLRLLRGWLRDPQADPALPERMISGRDAAQAALLRQALAPPPPPGSPFALTQERQAALLPLLGHQRCPGDFPLLRALALDPHSTPLRRAALEGVLRGLSAWPPGPLRQMLRRLAGDHQPSLAAAAIEGLARLPGARAELLQLAAQPLAPALAARVQRRLRSNPASGLLLVVHGRSGGVIPPELGQLARELQERRGAPVALWALTDPQAEPPAAPGPPAPPLTLVPLLLLPGQHVRADVPAIAAALRCHQPLRLRPFLGAWPLWQRALAAEATALAAAAGGARPLLLHHPLEGDLPRRYLEHLERNCAADCRAAPYSSPIPEDSPLARDRPLLPLTLAANRLTETLEPRFGPAAVPLLARPRLRAALLALLEAVP